jgi:hypothetical protein
MYSLRPAQLAEHDDGIAQRIGVGSRVLILEPATSCTLIYE